MVRPKKRPDNIEPIPEYLQTERMLRPMSREQVKESTKQTKLAENFGQTEFRWSLDEQLSKNPIARLGFKTHQKDLVTDFGANDSDVDLYIDWIFSRPSLKEDTRKRTGDGNLSDEEFRYFLQKYYKQRPDVFNNALYISSKNDIETSQKSLDEYAFSGERREEVFPDSIIVDIDRASPRVWSHEMTHRGFDRIREYREEIGKEEFTKKYGEKAAKALDLIFDPDKSPNQNVNEFYTEYLDNIDDAYNYPDKDKEDRLKFLDEHTHTLNIDRFQDDLRRADYDPSNFFNYQKESYGALPQLMIAAQDALSYQGEPPKAKETSGFIKTLRKFFGSDRRKLEPSYSEGGLETGDVNLKAMQAGLEEFKSEAPERNIEQAKEIGKFAFESLPGISTAITAKDIEDELNREDPSYAKIALLGGSELIGLIPGLGTAAKAGLRAAAKKAGLNKIVNALDAPTPKPESEIIAGPKGLYSEEKVTKRKRPEDSALPKIKSLTNAKDMKDAGKTNDEIFEATGLAYDPKTKLFRFEIDDTVANINFTPENIKNYESQIMPGTSKQILLTDFLSHPELFSRYPDFKNYNVKLKLNEDMPEGVVAQYNASTKTVIINVGKIENKKELKDSLFHELQHAVQFEENFDADSIAGIGYGANNRYIASKGKGDPRLDELRNNVRKSVNRHDEIQSKGPSIFFGDQSLFNEYTDLKKRIAYETKALRDYSYTLYRSNFAEIEARVVGERTLSDTERVADARKTYMESLPELTEEQIKEHGPFPENPDDDYFRTATRVPFYKDVQHEAVMESLKKDNYLNANKIEDLIKEDSMSQKNIDSNLRYGKDLTRALDKYEATQGGIFPTTMVNQQKPSSKPNVISFTKKKEDKELKDFSKNLNLKLGKISSGRSELVQELQEAGIYGNYQKGVKVQGQNYKKEPLPPFTITGLNLTEIKLENKFQQKTLKNVEDRLEIKFQYIEKDGKYYIPMLDIEQANGAKSQVYLDALKQKDTPILGGPTGTVTKQFAQGGAAMKDQMDLFKYGGLKDDGLTKDPVSGNEIPNGSMAKEVRDDIPAMLSEGEYVVPADVLRYYGMGFFENLRNQAKSNLTQMETSGRIGGEPISPEQAQRNMQIKPVGMPQPQAVNQGGVMQGFSNGNQVTYSGITPMQIRGAAYKTTSSYQDNVAKAEAEASTNTEEITVMKPHYGKNGEGPVQIAYVGSDINNLTVKSGQEELLKQYPLTKEEYDLFKKDTSFSGDDDPENPQTPTGSSTAWMDGIDFTSDASVEAEVEEILKPGAAGILGMGGPLLKGLSLFATGSKVGKARGLESWARASGKTTLADKIKNMITSNVNSNALSLFDKLGVAQGTYSLDQINAKIEEEGIVIGGGVAPPTPPGSNKKINIGGTDVNIKGPIDITKKDKDSGPSLAEKIQKEYKSSQDAKKITEDQSIAATTGVADTSGRTDALGKKAGDAGYVSKLKQKQIDAEAELATQINKGGLMAKKKRQR